MKEKIQYFTQLLFDRLGTYLIGLFLGVFISGIIAFLGFRYYFLPQLSFEEIPVDIVTQSDSLDISEPTPDSSLTGEIEPSPGGLSVNQSSKNSLLININTATQGELEMLPRIGPVIAEKIIAGRPYTSIIEIQRVSGIGVKTYERIKDQITVN